MARCFAARTMNLLLPVPLLARNPAAGAVMRASRATAPREVSRGDILDMEDWNILVRIGIALPSYIL